MEKHERDVIQERSSSDPKLKRLYDRHRSLESKLSQLQHRTYLTPQEEVQVKKLKKEKLSGVDQMMTMIDRREQKFL